MINNFEQVIGQKHLIGSQGPINKMVINNEVESFILYGQSGVGKTTIANIVCNKIEANVFKLNATQINKKKLEDILQGYGHSKLVLLIDEIHTLDKTKQNLLLPYLESQYIKIIATTTENPMYFLDNAFKSRVLMFKCDSIKSEDINEYLIKLNKEKYPNNILNEEVHLMISSNCNNNVRKAIKYFEFLVKHYESKEITNEVLKSIIKSDINYSKNGSNHYDLISALQKSIRASDIDASLYYLGKLLYVGEYNILMRRLIVIAYEDIGLANPNIVSKLHVAIEHFNQVGMPEGRIILSNIVIQMALSPKSTTAYSAINLVFEDLENYGDLEIPLNIRQNQHQDYKYNKEEVFYNSNLPKKLLGRKYLNLSNNSNYENRLQEQYLKLLKLKRRDNDKKL